MGKPCFSRLTKFFAIALLTAATAIAAIAVLSSPAAADSHTRGGGGGYPLKSWDTDNLSAGGVGPKNYRIPYHDYTDTAARVLTRRAGLAWRTLSSRQAATQAR